MKLIYTTLPNKESAQRIARQLVEQKLIACANWHEIESCYEWQGKRQDDTEVALLCKVTDEQAAAAASKLEELHPYEVPAVLVLPVDSVNEAYVSWMQDI